MDRGTISKDQKYIIDDLTRRSYEINGLLIEKKQPDRGVFYGMETALCKAVIFKGLKSYYKVLPEGLKANLL